MTEPIIRITQRPMRAADLSAVMALWLQTEGVGISDDETEEMLANYLERNKDLSAVAVADDGSIVGAVLCGHDGRRGYLYHLAVAPTHQGRGVGRALVEFALTALRHHRIARASVLVYADNHEGRAFWERLGWGARNDLGLIQKIL